VTADPEETTSTLPLLSEEVDVAKTTFETARVSVSRVTKEASELISTVLADETVEVSRTPIGRQVDAMPAIRQEGDTIVVPIVEERLVVERRLFLKEEVRVRRVRATRTHQELVPVRHHELVVSSTAVGAPHYGMGPAARSTQFEPDRSSKMNYHTVVAAFDSGSHARAAANALKAAGFHAADVSVLDRSEVGVESGAWTGMRSGLWQRLFGTDVLQHEAVTYDQAVDRGGAVVSVRVPDSEVAHATGILDLHHPIDVKDRALTGGAPAARVESAVAATAPVPVAAAQKVAVTPALASAHEEVLRLAEEQLQVGKRMIETGKTRVRRYVTERDVAADVTLHEEHAEVLRRAVTEPRYLADVDWADRSIEVVETAEQALVNKTARVVEEVALKKVGSDHVQTLHEKVRRQQVEVERLGPDGKLIKRSVN